jgi:hypothetical protein
VIQKQKRDLRAGVRYCLCMGRRDGDEKGGPFFVCLLLALSCHFFCVTMYDRFFALFVCSWVGRMDPDLLPTTMGISTLQISDIYLRTHTFVIGSKQGFNILNTNFFEVSKDLIF